MEGNWILSDLSKEDLTGMCDAVFNARVVDVQDNYLESNDEVIMELEFLDGPLSKTVRNYDIIVQYKK